MSDERTFTQAEVDQLIGERLKRERAKYQQEADQRAAELDRRERLLTAKADWQKKGLPVDLLDAMDITDEALERAESVLRGYTKNDNRPTLPRSAGADPHAVPYRAGADPLKKAFGLRKDE